MMFSSVQIKHECTGVEDVSSNNRINPSDNSKCPIFLYQDADYKYYQVPQLWNQVQVQNEVTLENENYEEQRVYETTENGSFAYTKDYAQNDMLFQLNQHHNMNSIHNQMNQQCSDGIMHLSDQSQLLPHIQEPKTISHSLTMNQSAPVKQSRLGRPPKSTVDTNVNKKLKCQCEICFKEFGHKSNLFIHMRTHNGERPYKCNQCDKCFTHSGNLAIHMRTHSGERPYGCQVCGKMFSHSGNLSTHLRTHSGVKPYKCSVCAKEFRHSGNLSIHERIHSGIKPFQCKVCGKDFYHSGNLTTHMKKHVDTNISSSQCENGEAQTLRNTVDFNNSPSQNSVSSLSLVSVNDIKSLPGANNVPIKDESNESLMTMQEILPVGNTEFH